MNARKPIQPSDQPPVYSLAFSTSKNRFIAGLATGVRSFRTDNCLTTHQPTLSQSQSIILVAQHDDRFLAYVYGGDSRGGKPSEVIFCDAEVGCEAQRFDLHEDVLGLRLDENWMTVILRERTIVFRYEELPRPQLPTPPPEHETDDMKHASPSPSKGPNIVHALYPTSPNPHALASLRNNTLILPAVTPGQVQIIPLLGGSKRILRAHNSSIRDLALSPDGSLLATASEQGTLIRVYDTTTLNQLGEYRRGSDKADIFSLAFSPGKKWLAVTSDKGTLHVFDLRPSAIVDDEGQQIGTRSQSHRKSSSYASHRLSAGMAGAMDKASSNSSGGRASSNPIVPGPGTYQGSVQEYYGLRPIPVSASSPPRVGISAVAALKASPFAPKLLKDVRSVASAPFFMGDEGATWQGLHQPSKPTIAATGGKGKGRAQAPALPGNPSGRPPRGVLAFDPTADGADEDEGARIYVVGGGLEARWECFELVPAEGHFGMGWVLVKKGFRRFLTRQFVD
ncbi:Phosphatidylinositol 3,5-bisphosphate-binding protein [Recurvomyces mirabilis]|nr:Phosphatidylinositol 3,5-bisphosphate-binding protein [Recurvomyces mirabilis]